MVIAMYALDVLSVLFYKGGGRKLWLVQHCLNNSEKQCLIFVSSVRLQSDGVVDLRLALKVCRSRTIF